MSDAVRELQEAKTALRERLNAVRRGLDAAWVQRESERVQERLLALDELRAARRVACYLALRGEVQTERIVQACHAGGHALYVPVFDPARRQYHLARYVPGANLKRGPLGILQPQGGDSADACRMDAVIVPGLAFDAAGGRLGHGGGHYDRMLAGATHPFKVAVAFDYQVVERVPMGDRDIRMDAVVTNSRVWRVEPMAAPGGRG